MSKPSDRRWFAAALLLLPSLGALGGATVDPVPVAPRPTETERLPLPVDGWQIRCWQYGRLLFEENRVRLPADRAGLRLSGLDRHGRPMYVVETANATCLVRGAVDERYYPPR
jgi:hypothetical protein